VSERVPDRDEALAFLDRMIVEARQMGDLDRVNALLEKRSNVDEHLAFMEITFPDASW
jgi:hypothetical protein